MDAAQMKAAVDASLAHLQAWMPWATNEPTSIADLEERLAGFAEDFDAGRAWLYGLYLREAGTLLGGIGLHPRASSAEGAVDHVEIGYWLRADATHRGYATEAVQAAVNAVTALSSFSRVEIRCDPNNTRSASVPRRLGFRLARTLLGETVTPQGGPRDTMVWELAAPAAP